MLMSMEKDWSELGFVASRLYVYDQQGRILADTRGEAGTLGEQPQTLIHILQQGKLHVGYDRDNLEASLEQGAAVIMPIRIQGQPRAALHVTLELAATLGHIQLLADRYAARMWQIVILTSLMTLLLVGWVIHRGLIRPIRTLSFVTKRIADGDLETRASALNVREFDRLGASVNRMAEGLQILLEEQEQAYFQAIKSLAKALEAKDAYTASHSARVAKFSVMLGRRLGLDENELKMLKQGALMHDIGKIGIDEGILNKPAPLDDDEFEIMKQHPVMTAAIMKPLKRFQGYAEIAAWHHERWDGKGYPDGLEGEAIPLFARIVGIADTWDAMTGDRVYRQGMPIEKALGILREEADSGQWDPQLLREFIQMVADEQEARHQVEHDMFETR
jgi:putative nucleotidyltransferase with HDIG domain